MSHHISQDPVALQPPVLQVKGLCGGPADMAFFNGIELNIPSGVSALLGDEGAGKTSLLRLLSGDLLATAGELSLRGQACAWRTLSAADVFWTDLRMPGHDLATPLQCWQSLRPRLPQWCLETQQALVQALQLTPHLNKRLDMLSTGSRRKVGLVASLAAGATVTLLDQAFVSLDQASIEVIKDALNKTSDSPQRAWLVADYEVPTDVRLSSVLKLQAKD